MEFRDQKPKAKKAKSALFGAAVLCTIATMVVYISPLTAQTKIITHGIAIFFIGLCTCLLFVLNRFRAEGSRIIFAIPVAAGPVLLASDYVLGHSVEPTLQIHILNIVVMLFSLMSSVTVVSKIIRSIGIPTYFLDVGMVLFALVAATYVIGQSMGWDYMDPSSDALNFRLATLELLICWLIVSLTLLAIFASQSLPHSMFGIILCPFALSGIALSNWFGIGLNFSHDSAYFLIPLAFGLVATLSACHYAYACEKAWVKTYCQNTNQNKLGFLAGIPLILAIPATLAVCLSLDLTINITTIELAITLIGCGWLTFRYTFLIYNLAKQAKIHELQSQQDDVTGLYNRRGWEAVSQNALQRGWGVISLNINRFKSINDLYGHSFGDKVLNHVANILGRQDSIQSLARISADEFIGLVTPRLNQTSVNNLLASLSGWHTLSDQQFYLNVSIGICFTKNGRIEQIQAQAQTAMSIAKSQDKGVVVATGEIDHIEHRRSLLATINDSIFKRDIAPIAQPIVDLQTYKVVGVEFLMRLHDGRGGTYQPSDFLQLTRENGQLRELTLLLAAHIVKHQPMYQGIDVHINVPPDFIVDRDFMDLLTSSRYLGALPRQHVVLEMTEDTDAEIQALAGAVKCIRSRGFQVAIDDFGTAYSSLSRLAAIEVDQVKLDRSMLQPSNHGGHIMIESSQLIIDRLGVSATIEGIETKAHYDLAISLGFTKGQGFYLEENLQTELDDLTDPDFDPISSPKSTLTLK